MNYSSSSRVITLLAFFTITLYACQDDDKKPEVKSVSDQEILEKYLTINIDQPDNYVNISYPAHYDANVRAQDNSPVDNPVTNVGATLGRVLFYDKNLSVNNTTSCASCHKQELGFVDEKQLSDGFEGGKTGAHSMRLGNIRYYQGISMFWDKRAESVEDQSTMPIQDGTEMGFDAAHGGFDALVEKLSAIEYYPILFRRAFGDSVITESRVQYALSQFLRSMESTHSKFDEGFAAVFNSNAPNGGIGQPFSNFTAQENQGKSLFLAPAPAGAGCAGCHQPPTFSLDPNSKSNGLKAGETTIFKAPSLKNIAITGPYMHDGSIQDLAGVVNHYVNGVNAGPALDVMKISVLILIALFAVLSCGQPSVGDQSQPKSLNASSSDSISYDSVLAKDLGADEYGMKSYVLAFLKSGPNRSLDSAESARLQRAHLDNIVRMAEAGQLVVAGPFLDRGDIRGIYVFNVSDIDSARKLTESDPAIQAGSLVMELHPWYSSAALCEVNSLHKRLAKKGI